VILQYLGDGLVQGAMIGLGAVGLTLTYAVLRFANFAHGELLTIGAYAALSALWLLTPVLGTARLAPFSFGWALPLALPAAIAVTCGVALLLDRLVLARLRAGAAAMTVVIASFGAALALRHLIVVLYGPQPDYYSRAIQVALPLVPNEVLGGLRLSPEQILVVGVTLVVATALHLVLTRTDTGRAMRALAESPTLAAIAGIDARAVVRRVWLIGAGLAGLAGVLQGLTVQVRPQLGFDLLLPVFAAAILGGIGSAPGALAGGLIVGIAESVAVPLAGAEYRQAVAFVVLILVLLIRPHGLFGRAPA
jgi:branched-chain amino acid transport system permease protein